MVNILREVPISLPEVYDKLLKIEKRDGELNYRAERVKKFIEQLGTIPLDKAIKLKQALKERLNLDDKIIVKILEIVPRDNDDLRAIFYGEVTKKEVFEEILKIIKEII